MSATSLRWLALAAVTAFGAGSCGLLQATAEAPVKVTQAVWPGERKQPRMELAEQQAEVLRFAGFAMNDFRVATRAFEQAAKTPEAALQAARWRLWFSRGMVGFATSSNPSQGLLDTIVALSALRVAYAREFPPETWNGADRPVLASLEHSQTNAWTLAGSVLEKSRYEQAHKVVEQWLAESGENPNVEMFQPPSFAELARGLAPEEGQAEGGLLAWISLDPLAGLEPTTRELARARLLAERSLFYLRVAPTLIDDQLLLHTLELNSRPEVVQLLADTARVSEAARSLAATAEGLPAAVASEREAALRQVSDELNAQRQGLVEDLHTAQEPLQAVLAETQATLAAGESMSAELSETIRTLDAFLANFRTDPGEPAPAADPDAPPSKPFDISEYGVAATRLGEGARELRQLVEQLDRSLPQVEQMVDVASTRAEASVDHAFRRGLQLGLALIAAAAVAVFAVRRLDARRVT